MAPAKHGANNCFTLQDVEGNRAQCRVPDFWMGGPSKVRVRIHGSGFRNKDAYKHKQLGTTSDTGARTIANYS